MKPAKSPRHTLRGLLILLFWVGIWQAASMLVGKPVLFASPLDTLRALLRLLPTGDYWAAVLGSLERIALGFLLALLLGLTLGVAAFRFPWLRELLAPLLTMMKTVPVASFIILILVWFGSRHLAVIVALLIVFPQIYFAALSGLGSASPELLEMARVFRVGKGKRAWQIYRPALFPYLITACGSALGMSWKAGIAAEVIGTPSRSIGEQMYLAKIYMDTAELFAWTLSVILLSMLFEKAVLWLLRRVGKTWN
ncbi:MAG: ABC transporter permease subunit [Oscillospiraceae bacterium]|nr:ABC transporter permease subunit [Oscillospiraceae bacterium]